MSDGEFKRTARLSDAAREEVLDRLDSGGRAPVGPEHAINLRKDERWPYRQSDIAVTVEHPGGGVSRLLLFARNLSAGGMSFVHNGFLYPNSTCKVMLPQNDGGTMQIVGTIVRCRHVHGLLHEVGMKFEHRIDPTLFINPGDSPGTRQPATIELPELLGRVAALESSKVEAALLQHHLKMGGVNPLMLHTSGAALDLVKKCGADIFLTELNIAGHDGVEFIRKLRELKFSGPICVITAEMDESRLNQARRVGADHILAKPYDSPELIALLIQMNERMGTALARTAIFSSIDEQAGMTNIVAGFIAQTHQTAREIESAAGHGDARRLRELLLSLKGSAPGYGFVPLGDLARQALELMDSQRDAMAINPRVRVICSLCRRLRMRRPQGSGREKSRAA